MWLACAEDDKDEAEADNDDATVDFLDFDRGALVPAAPEAAAAAAAAASSPSKTLV